ncbi:MAG: inositol monophosphatase [Thermoguttaceae bacterium]|nr:inositol monophosphatase [Thermoguttaceae bacterium]
MDALTIRKYEEVCQRAAQAGGQVLLQKMGKVQSREKGPRDWVSEADLAAQEAICQVIRQAFPEDPILGEETTLAGPVEKAEGVRWLVDPLDGTTNYIHGVPHFAVSVAVEEKGTVWVGAIFDPVHGDLYTASRDRGAWLNGRRLQTSQVQSLTEAIAAAGFPPKVQDDSPDLRVFLEALKHCQTVRRTGSTALNLGYLAAGWFDLFWSFSTNIWDIAAGVLLVEEAGGVISNPYGGDIELHTGQFLASANPTLHQLLCELVRKAGVLPPC